MIVADGAVILPLNVMFALLVPPVILLTAKDVMFALAIFNTPSDIEQPPIVPDVAVTLPVIVADVAYKFPFLSTLNGQSPYPECELPPAANTQVIVLDGACITDVLTDDPSPA